MRTILWLTPLAVLTLAACGDKEDEETGDTSVDTDTETDTETDDGPVYTALDGTLTFAYDVNGTPTCDADIHVASLEPYTGRCFDCDFAFKVEGEVTADRGTEDCNLDPRWTFVPSGWYTDFYLMAGEKLDWYGYDLYNAVLSGYGVTFEYYGNTYSYPGPYWSFQAYTYAGYSSGTMSWDGTDLSWSTDFYSWYLGSAYHYYCSYYSPYGAASLFEGEAGTGTIDCSGTLADVWTVDLMTGDTVGVSVDTVDMGSAFDPAFTVLDPSGCTVAWSDDQVDCSYPPPNYFCPSYELTAAVDGTHKIVVMGLGDCAGTESKYNLQVSAPGPVNLTQVADEVESRFILTGGLTASATLTQE